MRDAMKFVGIAVAAFVLGPPVALFLFWLTAWIIDLTIENLPWPTLG